MRILSLNCHCESKHYNLFISIFFKRLVFGNCSDLWCRSGDNGVALSFGEIQILVFFGKQIFLAKIIILEYGIYIIHILCFYGCIYHATCEISVTKGPKDSKQVFEDMCNILSSCLVPCVLDQCIVTSSGFIALVFITRQQNTVSQIQLQPARLPTANQEVEYKDRYRNLLTHTDPISDSCVVSGWW